MDADTDKLVANAPPSFEGLIRSSFPPLDPNGQPFSMILRGAAAELVDLRFILSAHPTARELLQMLDQAKGEDCDADIFDDIEDTEDAGTLTVQRGRLQGRHEINSEQQAGTTACTMNGRSAVETSDVKKRGRDCKEDAGGSNDDDDDEEDEIVDQEHLLLYVPSVKCTCSSWRMRDVSGEMFVTSLRVLFLPKNQNDDGTLSNDDVAIDGRCIALHAVDSAPLSVDNHDERERSHYQHVYCQLVGFTGDEDDSGYSSTISMITPITVVDEKNTTNGDAENDEEVDVDDEISDADGDGTIEVYFRPDVSNEGGENVRISQCNLICESIFKALTKLASLNPTGESNDDANGGGGFFNMLSLMDDMGSGFGDGFDGEIMIADHDGDGEDDMVVRLGGSNNFVENDDENDDAATDMERQAMLRRLDDMLVVPPEYEIASSNDGQFDDADDDDEKDADDDEIL